MKETKEMKDKDKGNRNAIKMEGEVFIKCEDPGRRIFQEHAFHVFLTGDGF